jgi:hypothetical protein
VRLVDAAIDSDGLFVMFCGLTMCSGHDNMTLIGGIRRLMSSSAPLALPTLLLTDGSLALPTLLSIGSLLLPKRPITG